MHIEFSWIEGSKHSDYDGRAIYTFNKNGVITTMNMGVDSIHSADSLHKFMLSACEAAIEKEKSAIRHRVTDAINNTAS